MKEDGFEVWARVLAPTRIGLSGWRGNAPPQPNKKNATFAGSVLGGLKRIRTAVAAFAELCLATRPSDHITLSGVQIYKLFLFSQNFCHFSTEKSKFLLFHIRKQAVRR